MKLCNDTYSINGVGVDSSIPRVITLHLATTTEKDVEVVHEGEICAVSAEGGLKAVTFERIKSAMNE